MRSAPSRPQPVEVVSFGCRLNLVESDVMRRAALAAGRENLVIVNTCAVTAEAERQARQAIRRIRRERRDAEIIVTGCAAEIDPRGFAAMPEVGRVVGNRAKTDPRAWAGSLAPPADRDGNFVPPPPSVSDGVQDHARAFVPVQTGCDHSCTFCIIPLARGPSRSLPPEEVVAAARRLVGHGFGEIVLTGVDLTAYGQDLPGTPTLGMLVRAILGAAPELARLRLSSIDCVEADAGLTEALAREPRLMPYLHLSLQAGDDMILKRMKRRHSRADAVSFCADLRRKRPEIVLGADLIAGFPTETEAMFENTLALVEDCGLTHLHVFPFSPRPGTAAARMPAVAPALAKDRAQRLRAAGDAALANHLAAQVGKVLPVLTERGGTGRTEDFSIVRIGPVAPSRLIDVAIVASDGKTLEGAILPSTRN
jgi:threonylcarbamoyladenosine tRNA methylthiotransferase MtaB